MSEAPVPGPREKVVQRLQEMKIVLDPEIPYQLEKVFPKITGWGSNAEVKRRGKLIRLVEPVLAKMLLPDEEVWYVAKGVQYSLAENYFMGALWAAMMNQTVFVFTNARLLMMRSNSRGKPTEMFWMIYYSEIAHFKSTWTGVLSLKLSDKKTLKFTNFPSLDRKSMPPLFQAALDDYRAHGLTPMASQSKENLCCHCFQVVAKGDYLCNHCGTEYWTPKQLALRSLLFPSWGDICMRHYVMAFIELLGYLISWGIAVAGLVSPNPAEGWFTVAFIFLFEHPIDAIMTYFVASKGLSHRRDAAPDFVAVEAVNPDSASGDDDRDTAAQGSQHADNFR